MTKEIFVAIVDNLKKSIAQDLKIDNSLSEVGIEVNRDQYTDYFWEAANQIFYAYFDDASVEMIFDFICGEPIVLHYVDCDIDITNSATLYDHCTARYTC